MNDQLEKRKLKIETRLEVATIIISLVTMVVTPVSSAFVVKYQLGQEFGNWLQEKRFEREEKHSEAKAAALKELIKAAESYRVSIIRYEEELTDVRILEFIEARQRDFADGAAAGQTHKLCLQIQKLSEDTISKNREAAMAFAIAIESGRLYLPHESLDELGSRMRNTSQKEDSIISDDEINKEVKNCKDVDATNELYFTLHRSYPERRKKQGYAIDVADVLDTLSKDLLK